MNLTRSGQNRLIAEQMVRTTIKPQDLPYGDEFFDRITSGSLQSARVVVPIILNLVKIDSMVDVGCGRGAWLKAFQENGVKVIRGLDGGYIPKSNLLIDASYFTPVDLCQPLEAEGRYTLAVCLEVAERLPEKAGASLIRMLTSLAPLILFSAAIPGQGGDGHINEQCPDYWKTLFLEHGYKRLDPIRSIVFFDKRVEWWYRQNIFLYASSEAIASSEVLQAEEKAAFERDIEWVRAEIFYRCLFREPSVRNALRELGIAVRRAIKRLGRISS